MYHSEKEAKMAEANFHKVFAKKENPDEIKTYSIKNKSILPADLLTELKFVTSKN